MIHVSQALAIHLAVIQKFGGALQVRDKASLEAALQRPYQTFDGKELYPSLIKKAAALIESIISNHPFVDGNKRTGYVLMRILLLLQKLDVYATHDEKYDFVIAIAAGESDYVAIHNWLQLHVLAENGT